MPSQVVTLQLGDFSSLSAAHYWNSLATQLRLARWAGETVFDFDAYFRDQEKLRPRCILFERPRPFRSMEDVGSLPEAQGPEDIKKLAGFQGALRSWHDLSFVNHHHRSICSVSDEFYSTEPKLSNSFRKDLITNELLNDAEEAIRFMAEDCDHLAEFQILCDAASGFGGLTCTIVEQLLADEYPKAILNSWTSYGNCQDFTFLPDRPRHDLISSSLAYFSKFSNRLAPIDLQASTSPHALFDEQYSLASATEYSVLVGAAIDTLSTCPLTGSFAYSTEALIDLRLSTPAFGSDPFKFTSLATGKQDTVLDWSKRNCVTRVNHKEETYPEMLSPKDLPIYAPNHVYSGYQQQATSSIALQDTGSQGLTGFIQNVLLKDLKRASFAEIEDGDAIFDDVKETLYSITDLDRG